MDNGESSYRRFLDGDENAFEELVKLYRNSLTFFIMRYVHNISAAEDICADAFAALIIHKNKYNFKTSLKTYLFMIARSKALNYLKHEARFGSVDLYENAADISDEQTLEEAVINEEGKRALLRAIAALPENYRCALHLVYFENLSYEEAGRVMSKNTKHINNLIYRAKIMLRRELEKEGALL